MPSHDFIHLKVGYLVVSYSCGFIWLLTVCRVVQTLTHNFRNATSIVRAPLRLPIKPNNVLVKIIYAGVNASDVSCYIFQEDLCVHLCF